MSTLKRLLFIMLLASLWSPSFLFIKVAVQEVPPMTLVSLRVTLAAIILLMVLRWRGVELPKSRLFWAYTAGMATFSSVIPFCCFSYAEQTIDSALAALINGSSLMFTAVLAQIFIASDRLNPQKILGIILSIVGLVLLFATELFSGVSGTTLGMISATVAAFSYAASHVYGKIFNTGQKALVAPTAQCIAAAVLLWPFALVFDQPWTLPIPSNASMLSICGLAVLGTVCAFIVYYYILEHCGPTAVSTVACFFPVGGMLLGYLFLDETFTAWSMLASLVILLGMFFVNGILKFPERRKVPAVEGLSPSD